MTDNKTRAFAMVHQDRLPIAQIAEILGVSGEEVLRLAGVEGKARTKAGTFPLTSTVPDRGHTVTASEERVCDEHGPYTSDRWELNNPPEAMPAILRGFWSQCPTCDRMGQAEVERRTAEIRNRKANQDALRREMFRASGIPERFLDKDVWRYQRGMPKQNEAWEAVKSYCMRIEDVIQNGRCLVLFGASGTGKTHLACGVVRHVIEKGGTALYITIQDAVGRIRSTYSKKGDSTEDEVLAEFQRVDVLAIDEIGRQSDSAHERETFFRILNRRYQDLRPTVLVSNLERKALHEFLGQAMCDRLLEAGGRFLNFDWASQRNRKASKDQDDSNNNSKETDR